MTIISLFLKQNFLYTECKQIYMKFTQNEKNFVGLAGIFIGTKVSVMVFN